MARVIPVVENVLVITKAELDQLDTIVAQQPAGFVLPIIDFFRLIKYKRDLESQKKEVAKIPTSIPGQISEKAVIQEPKENLGAKQPADAKTNFTEKTNPE